MILPLLLSVFLATSVKPSNAFDELPPQVRKLAAGMDGQLGVAALEIETGRQFSFHGDERFPMGSVFKFPVSVETFRQVDAGQLRLTDSYTLQPHDLHPGYSPIRAAAKGKAVSFTLDRLIEATLRDSDNSAADYLMCLLGGPAELTRRMRVLGITGIRIDRSEAQMTADLWSVKSLPPERSWTPEMFEKLSKEATTKDREAGAATFAVDPRDTSTPQAVVALLRKLQRGELGLSKESNARMLRLMTETKMGKNRIRSVLPPGIPFAHKTGTMPGTVNDGGIITLPNGNHLVVVVFVKAMKGETEVAEPIIARVAKAIYEAAVRR